MHPFFEPLDEREAMLLLTALTVGGKEQLPIFQHLPPETASRMQEKADALLAIAAQKRVPFMVKQMKQAMAFKGLRGVERVDPSWVLQRMRGESPRVVASILVSLPPPFVRSILKRLPSGVRKNLPPKDELKKVPVELVRAVRESFESRFDAMPHEGSSKVFSFRDMIHLERKELQRLMRDLGLIELGQAFVAVGKLALAELCRRLPRSKAEELIMAVRNASRIDVPDLKTAQRFLSRVVVNFADTEEFFRNAGLWRLAKATLLESTEFRSACRQRLPRTAGEMYYSFVEKAGEMGFEEDVLRRLQDTILLRIRQLAKEGRLTPRWATIEMTFHDPDYVAQAEVPNEPPPAEEAPPEESPPFEGD